MIDHRFHLTTDHFILVITKSNGPPIHSMMLPTAQPVKPANILEAELWGCGSSDSSSDYNSMEDHLGDFMTLPGGT